MADLRFNDKNNQKKEISVFASGIVATSDTMDDILFTLPEASLVTSAYVVVLTASGVLTSALDIKVGATIVADEVAVDATGVQAGTQGMAYFPTGGIVTVTAGAVAPDTAGSIKVIVEYIETKLSEGTYTD